MLNKDIFKMIEYASSFTKTNISTNGKCMTREMAEKLILSGVTDVIVSIDGVTQEVYEQYRVGGSVTKAMWALSMLSELNKNNGNKVKISPQFIVFKHNQHQMQAFEGFCNSLGLKLSFKSPYIRRDSRYENSDMQKYIRSSYPDIGLQQEAMGQNCTAPKETFTVLLDGTCVACCHDHNSETNYGNIFKQDVMEIWNSPAYRKDREAIMTGNAPDSCLKTCLNWTLDHSVCVDESKDRILEMV
jgi:MoaA/NifB/PqqE/SkfB family radical SAM enzyme